MSEAEPAKYCVSCGQGLDSAAHFCPSCGRPSDEQLRPRSDETTPSSRKPNFLRSKLFKFVLLPVLVFLTFLIVVGILAPAPDDAETGFIEVAESTIAPADKQLAQPEYQPNTAGESKSEPAPFGLPIIHKEMEVEVTGVVRGWQADTSFFSTDEGHEWVLVFLRLKNLGSEDKTKSYNRIYFRVTGAKGLIYDKILVPETPYPIGSGEFFGGAEISGDIVQQVRKDDTDLILIYSPPFQGSRFLSLTTHR